MDPQSIEHRCLAYWYTESVFLLDLVKCMYIEKADGPEWQFYISTDI